MCGDDGVLSWFMYQKLLEFKLKEVISREPTLLVLVVGVPNVGKSSLINLIHQIVSSCFPGEYEATLGPLPSVSQDISGYKYLLAVFNTQGTPLQWKHLNNRRLQGIQYDSKEKHEYNLKDFRPKRRKLPNDSDMLYIE
ncbi:hypothetical protein CMV_019651 [Castanea mollissima]|uniref:G domain-containing protein n=1 Tax=Castanea mollissima TaxID=60419 RepID=A0A8J4QJE3_9ROSI|nr:hypothetical protein CMV_019651 [Castanea mollissima]